MSKALNQLEQKTAVELLEIIRNIEKNFDGVTEFIHLHYLLDPNQKIKKIGQNYSRLQRKTKFHDYYETIAFFNELSQEVISPLKDLSSVSPQEVIKILERMIDQFETLFENKDDSSGCAMDFLYECFSVLGETWNHVYVNDRNTLPEKVAQYYFHQGYIGMAVFSYFKLPLGKDGLSALEQPLQKDHKALLHVIELQNDPDKYKKVITSLDVINTEWLLTLAELFIHHWRYAEAITTLKEISETRDDQYYKKRQELLIHSLTEEGKTPQVQEERWLAFEKTLDATYYKDFLKNISITERETYRLKALEISEKKSFIYRWSFLEDIGEYNELSKIILDNLNKFDPKVYVKRLRDTSKNLASNGYFLVASLMRRMLVDNVLSESASRYYNYAVSDLKLSLEFGKKVINWENFMNNQTYIKKLKNEHKRKVAFWGLVNKSKLPIATN